MQSVEKTVPQTEVAEAKKGGMRRPKKLVKGSAATKRWMAHLRAMRKTSRKAKTPARRSRKTPARRGRKASRKSSKTPKRSRKTPMRRSRKGRKSSPKRK